MGLETIDPITDEQTGFIHHPTSFPIEYKLLRKWHDITGRAAKTGRLGVIFTSETYIKPGQLLEIIIPLRNEAVQFTGKVVLVRHYGDHYEIGVGLFHNEDACKVRIVEQICHIEAYLHHRKFKDGPYTNNRDRLTKEWIAKYAANIPTF
jgi:hypothetical protein